MNRFNSPHLCFVNVCFVNICSVNICSASIRLCLRVTLSFALFCTTNAYSLTTDKEQPITIHSNQAERDEIAGTTTYSGNVVMEQGSMKITASKIVIYSSANKVSELVAVGSPASYKQKPAPNEADINASAKRLEYRVSDATLMLLGSAHIKQEGTTDMRSDKIEYDVKKSIVRAGGSTSQTQGSDGRVRMVIQPKVLNTDKK